MLDTLIKNARVADGIGNCGVGLIPARETLFDTKTVGSEPPVFVDDLPGGKRLIARARGIVATFIRGVQVMREGHETGDRPGRVIRSTEGAR